ncbi:MAG TPA: signal protein [Holosporales bacterium]|nr:signal protein [Holosporales bacterium]
MKEINKKLDQIIKESSFVNPDDFVIQNLSRKSKDEVELCEKISLLLRKNYELSEQSEKIKKRSQGVLDTMLDALIVIDHLGNIQSANIATEKIFGYKEEDIVGENIKILMPEPYHSEHDGYLKNYKDTGVKKVIGSGREVSAKRKDGSIFPASLAVGQIIVDGESFFTGTLKDISVQKSAEDELFRRNRALEEDAIVKSHLTQLLDIAQSASSFSALTQDTLSYIAKIMEIGYGTFYLREEENNVYKNSLKIQGTYAYKNRKNLSNSIEFNEGLVGQCAYEKTAICLTKVPSDYIHVSSSLGEASPMTILVQPILFDNEVLGVMELASFREITDMNQRLIKQVAENLGVIINRILSKQRTEELLDKYKIMSEQLETQQHELKSSNTELIDQTELLRKSEKDLQFQQSELKIANEELEKNTDRLEEKQKDLENSHRAVKHAKKEIEKKASELEAASKYKSQFLANMSHELRTPLNSLLLLSGTLTENRDRNLTSDQITMLKYIHEGGEDLLRLINDILDISKVESGLLEIEKGPVDLDELGHSLKNKFEALARKNGIDFHLEIEKNLPCMISDSFRIQQVLKNLLSNAFKFTTQGSIHLRISCPPQEVVFTKPRLNPGNCLVFSVIDTGIGIPQDKQQMIFEAFQQVDGSVSRKYGGTGLGLSISKELVNILGGEIQVDSIDGEGSTFRCFLPLEKVEKSPVSFYEQYAKENAFSVSNDEVDVDFLKGKSVLIVDDDVKNTLSLSMALKGYEMNILTAENGDVALQQLEENLEIDLVLTDLMMPIKDGYETIKSIRSMEKHINLPIIVLTANTTSDTRTKCINLGASDLLTKPIHIEPLISLLKQWTQKRVC